MADMGMYHALDPSDPNNNPNANGQLPAQQGNPYRPQVAPPPSGYQQSGAPNFQAPPQQYGQAPGPSPYPQPPYGGPSPAPAAFLPYGQQPSQPSPYGQPPQQPQYGAPGDVAALAQGMSGMDLAAQPAPSRTSRKKQRAHAYHELDQAPSAGGGNLPPFSPNVGDNLQQGFLSQNSPSPQMPGQQGSQFPMQAAPQFTPQNVADPAAFNARPGGGSHGVSTSGSVDPNALPSVPLARDSATEHYQTQVYPTLQKLSPPSATSDFVAYDQGNASPKFARLTLNAVPATSELLTSTALPLALMLQPLAKLRPEEDPVPVLDFGDAGPPRCRRCRTYINPFMQFLAGGSKFRCNMCLFPNNEVPQEYFAPVDMSGARVDREQRPELTRGTVEFVVPKEYWAKREGVDGAESTGGVPMRYLFLLDVTEAAINKGTLAAFVAGIREALYGDNAYEKIVEGEEADDGKDGLKRKLPRGCKVGICTFDKEIHFYNLNVRISSRIWESCTDFYNSLHWMQRRWW